jgi:dipeptidyl aminopeptidase/acylaminoacyl peptidase
MTTRRPVALRLGRLVFAFALAVVPLQLLGQGPQPAAPAAAPAPLSWADELISVEGFVTPPPELADAVLAPRYLNVSLSNLSPDKQWFLNEVGDGPVVMKTFAKPYHELGGQFIDFKANRARALTIRNNVGIEVISAADGTKKAIQLPPGARVSGSQWAPDGRSLAFLLHGEDATHIWIADVASGKARQVTKTPLLATMVTGFEFVDGGKQIAAVVIPEGRAAMPQAPAAPTGPTVKVTAPERNRLRTFASLMSTPHDFELLEWHATGQVALIDVAKGTVRKVGRPQMVRSVDASPDGKYFRVTRITKPFSYDVPASNFGTVEELVDLDGKVLVTLNERPINMGAASDDPAPTPDPPAVGGGRGGAGAAQAGRRELAWRADGQGLTYLEQDPPPAAAEGTGPAGRGGRGAAARGRGGAQAPAADEGQRAGARPAPRMDRVYQWLPPFDDESKRVIFESATRLSSHRFSPDMQMLFATEREGQSVVEFAVNLAEPATRHVLVRYQADDLYANPGSLVTVRGGGGGGRGGGGRGGFAGGGGLVQLSSDRSSVFYQGTIHDKDPQDVGTKTFLDRVAIATGEKQRLYESENDGIFERIASIIDVDAPRFVVARESTNEVPQNFLVDGTRRVQLTQNRDYTPDVTNAKKERFTVTRADGFTFRVTVTLPADFVPGGPKPPALFWFYPREFSDQESYDRPDRTFNRNSFQNFGTRSMAYLVRLGYAVVEPDSPIVGRAGQMNNNYVHDLRNNLAAVIDELDRRGLADRTRLGIGGHSYGAFSTVNAMVHTPFFKAGIAGNGAYNRTLTPIGFQSERRDLWEAPHVYLNMSPFLHAHNMTGALLMYHGLQDQNVGTDPINSIRLYHALNGLGKTASLYLYDLEDHGPATRETLLDLWARWAAWLDKYVKNPEGEKPDRRITTTDQAAIAR